VSDTPPWRHALAAAVFLAAALWALRAVLPAPASTFPLPTTVAPSWRGITQADQKLTAANITWNAHRFLTAPWRLYEPGQCYPAYHGGALGPSQFGEGLLGIVPYVVTRDPILTYNVVAVATLWLPALAMYALVHAWTGSAAGGFVAGLLFALHPVRVLDVMHPDVHGNHWAPLTLLFTYRLVAGGRWRDAVGLLASLVLQILGSFYQLLAFTVIGGTCAAFLFVATRARLRAVLTKLTTVAAGAAIAAWIVLRPYTYMRDTWHVVSGRPTMLFWLHDFGFGGPVYPGSVLVGLALVGLVQRWWHGPSRRFPHDPRVALLIATALTLWASVWNVPLGPLGTAPSLFELARDVLPGLDAIRAGGVIGFGVVLTGAALAGYGAAALTAGRSRAVRAAITVALAGAAAFEVFDARAAALSFGRPMTLAAYAVRPPQPLLDLYRSAARGAVLDVPYDFRMGTFVRMAESTFASAFHLHPVAACYNSFQLPLHQDIVELAKRLGLNPNAVPALHALGIDTVVTDDFARGGRSNIGLFDRQSPGIALVGRASAHSAYRLTSDVPVTTDVAVLGPVDMTAVQAVVRGTDGTVRFTFRNGSTSTFRHPDPIEPSLVRVQWRTRGADAVAREDTVRMLLPAALGAGDELARTATVPVPANSDDFDVSVVVAAAPERVLARAHVVTTAGSAAPPPSQ
jgi:hypothetical protein